MLNIPGMCSKLRNYKRLSNKLGINDKSKKIGENINISLNERIPFLAQQKFDNFKITVLENNL